MVGEEEKKTGFHINNSNPSFRLRLTKHQFIHSYPIPSAEREDQGGELQASVPSSRGGKDGGVCSRRADT